MCATPDRMLLFYEIATYPSRLRIILPSTNNMLHLSAEYHQALLNYGRSGCTLTWIVLSSKHVPSSPSSPSWLTLVQTTRECILATNLVRRYRSHCMRHPMIVSRWVDLSITPIRVAKSHRYQHNSIKYTSLCKPFGRHAPSPAPQTYAAYWLTPSRRPSFC